ncbi:MAG: hypothetical protein P4L33_03435 [Capsulimonadaceae bacterium]|nr:hypothetical protein [Capsulimonadaceae bacterium]
MQTLLIALAVILLLLWITGHVIGALFHLMAWLFHLIPIIVLALVITVVVMRLLSRRG